MRCQNYAPIISSDKESYGITSNLTANLTDCVGVSENVYPIAADANESENCLYFISGGEKLEDALLADICDISLTIGETDGKWILQRVSICGSIRRTASKSD